MEEEKYTTAPMDTEVEVIQDEANQYEEAEERKPKTDLTEEEAKVAAENVKEVIQVLDYYKKLENQRQAKFDKMKEEAEALPEGHYKKKQLATKMLELAKKMKPKIVWNSREKGTYRKEQKKVDE